MLRLVIGGLAAIALATAASAATFTNYESWEGDNPDVGSGPGILGNFGDITPSIDTDLAFDGDQSLKLVDAADSGTPQAYVAWIEGLEDGDTVTASFWAYDTTPGASPSGRIWGHYTSNPDLSAPDVNSFAGSAGGNNTFSDGTGWSWLVYTWTFDAGTDRTGMIIEARTYSSPGDTIWVDALMVQVNTDSGEGFIETANTLTIIPEPASLMLLGLAGLVIRRR
jgi:hypothetical protein